MSVTLAHPEYLNGLTLLKGAHGGDCNDGSCLYEAYNWIRFGKHDDGRPADVSQALHSMGIGLNDAFPDDRRQELTRFLPQPDGTDPLAGTHDDGLEKVRSYMAVDWLIRTYTPAWLDLAGHTAEAQALRDLRRIVDLAAVEAAEPVITVARTAAWEKWRAYSAADSAAYSAAYSAARSAAYSAARSAAYSAADLAAYSAADSAAYSAADLAAYSAADSAAYSAARSAARDHLAPTVTLLQTSALELFAAMIRPEVAA